MSDSPSKSPSPKQAKPLHRLSIGTFVVVQIALAAIILLTANYLSALYHQDRDLSRGNEFSLSPLTKKLLRSDPVKSRAQPIRMIVAVRKSSEHYNRLRAMTEAYEHKSRGAVTVEFVDPIRDGDRAFEIAEAYDHIFVDEEQMMPFIPVVRVKDVDEAIKEAVKAEHGYKHTAVIHSRNIDALTKMAQVADTTLFIKNGPCMTGLGLGGEGFLSFSIATPTGEGVPTPMTFTRSRRCVMVENLNLY